MTKETGEKKKKRKKTCKKITRNIYLRRGDSIHHSSFIVSRDVNATEMGNFRSPPPVIRADKNVLLGNKLVEMARPKVTTQQRMYLMKSKTGMNLLSYCVALKKCEVTPDSRNKYNTRE